MSDELKPMFMRGYSLEEVRHPDGHRDLAMVFGYSERLSGPYTKMKVVMPPEGAKILAKELAGLAEELGSTHH